MPYSASVRRLALTFVALSILLACLGAEATATRATAVSDGSSVSDTTTTTTTADLAALVRLTEDWRREQEDALNHVLSEPLASGVLMGNARKETSTQPITTTTTMDAASPSEDTTQDHESVSHDTMQKEWHQLALAERLRQQPLHLIHLITQSGSSGDDAEASHETVASHVSSVSLESLLADANHEEVSTSTSQRHASPAATADSSSDDNEQEQEDGEAVREVTDSPGTVSRATATKTTVAIPDSDAMLSRQGVRVPVTVVGTAYTAIQFEGFKDHTLTSTVQIRSKHYDSAVMSNNCEGMYVNIEMRNNWRMPSTPGSLTTSTTTTTTTAAAAAAASPSSSSSSDDESSGSNSGGSTGATVSAGSDSAWAQVWGPIAQIFDTSMFCQMLSSLSMRIDNIPRTEPYYVVIKSGISSSNYYAYYMNESEFKCELEVFLTQRPRQREQLMRVLFALVVPLVLLTVPFLFTLWRADIISQLIGDVDFGEWLWFIPYYLRYLIIKGAVGAYNALYEWRLEQRTRAAQRALEERHRQLMRASDVAITSDDAAVMGGSGAGADAAAASDGIKMEPPLLTRPGEHRLGSGRGAAEDEDEDAALRPRMPGLRTGAHELVNNTAAVVVADGTAGDGAGSEGTLDRMERFNQPASVTVQNATPREDVRTAASVPSPSQLHAHPQRPPREETSMASSSTHSASITVGHTGTAPDVSEAAGLSPDVTAVEVDALNPMSPTTAGFRRQRNVASGRAYLFGAGGETASSPSATTTVVTETPSTDAMPPSAAEAANAAASSSSERTRETTRDVSSTQSARGNEGKPREEAEAEEEEEEKFCRICRDGDEMEPLIAPCQCTGSVRWIHRSCLDHWRLESAKRNLTNVNNCEICKQPFTIGIKKSTLFWQSSRQFVRTSILVFTSIVVFVLIVVVSHAVIGELSCTAVNHQVAYDQMFSLEGMVVSVFHYSLVVFTVMFAHLIVYSWFRGRPEVEEYVNEMHMIPPFWTRWNGLKIVGVSLALCAQGLSMGYLLKYFFYATSNIGWNWELSPFLGGVCLIFLYSILLGPAEAIRGGILRFRERRRHRNGVTAEDVVVEANPEEEGGASGSAPRTSGATANAQRTAQPIRADVDVTDVDFTRQFNVPPEQRVIRAMEYCPPHPVARKQ